MRIEWRRWGKGGWCAHLFIEGVQQCSTKHGVPPFVGYSSICTVVTDLSRHGVPYGKVCARCHRVFNGKISGIKR